MTEYVTLGRSGLMVSRLGLGTNMFGTQRGWGIPGSQAREVFLRFIERGGNLVDTASSYTNGESESILGDLLAGAGLRDRVVLATKFSFSTDQQNPNASGNGRKNLYRSLDESLRRLKTSYIDLYWLHRWDEVTPPEEVVSSLDHLVASGSIRYYGLSNVPAWFAARAHAYAVQHGKEPPVALQPEYSLINREIEAEVLPMARSLGLGVCPYLPLASGFLSGKYDPAAHSGSPRGRLDHPSQKLSAERRFSERNWKILAALREAAKTLGKPPGQVALNWVASQPGVTAPLVGATRPEQVDENFNALAFTIPADLRRALDEVSRPPEWEG